jgi:cbb3-type cytochrome oxidase subunit 1
MQLSLRYVKASLLYLVAGATLMLLTFSHILAFEMTAFYFMQLYGFVAMMIFGLSYLFVPSFAHAFLHSLRLARLQFWLMNVGVIGLTVSFSGLVPYNSTLTALIVGSLLVQVVALYLHAYNLWRTMRGWKGSPGEQLARETAAKSSSAESSKSPDN